MHSLHNSTFYPFFMLLLNGTMYYPLFLKIATSKQISLFLKKQVFLRNSICLLNRINELRRFYMTACFQKSQLLKIYIFFKTWILKNDTRLTIWINKSFTFCMIATFYTLCTQLLSEYLNTLVFVKSCFFLNTLFL